MVSQQSRTGKNCTYLMEDALLGAFSVFYTQCPSFLTHQIAITEARGKSNAQTLFGMRDLPSDNHIRNLLDPVDPQCVFPAFERTFNALNDTGQLDTFWETNGQLLIALDGTMPTGLLPIMLSSESVERCGALLQMAETNTSPTAGAQDRLSMAYLRETVVQFLW